MNKLKNVRLGKRLYASDLAFAMGIPVHHYEEIEEGRRKLTHVEWHELADRLRVDVREIIPDL